MQKQETDTTAPPAAHGVEPAPPAYSPNPNAGAEPEGATSGTAPAPAKELPPVSSTTPNQMPAQAVPGVVPLERLAGSQPLWIDCPFCQQRTTTTTRNEGTPMQVVAGVLCCFLCVCLACVPCLAGWFEDTNYFCSQCHKKVATKPDSGPVVVYGPGALVPSKYAQVKG